MKKLIGFLVVAVLTACTCLSQIPDQLIYVDENCEAVMPDFRPHVVVADNCDNATITQTPYVGSLLDSGQPQVQVVIKASDISGNESNEIRFNVVLLDTISPVLSAGPGLLVYNLKDYGRIHNQMHRGLVWKFDSVRAVDPTNVMVRDTSYRHDNLVTISSLNSEYIVGSFSDSEHRLFSADSLTLADRCDIPTYSLRLHFLPVE